ncbi:DnaD and phage-associated domain-containing protein [Ruminococcus flavefaciens]|uniref:DnaD and phage-associated domain-containing protein n=1 Tax=Ruminococcus flavefaciens TaxID=1265 RepID=A0A1H6HMT2_RUMFL|nr:DnaD domain protein [Ruminococcus flavefaciens]SEH37031.1 DnaD and phage-associated domain-containing protein [Ruminococcus flavefaciens]
MEYKVNCGIWGAMFGVPVIVADNFLKLATGDQIKVLLYLLRCSGKICTSEDISANTGVTVQVAEDAVLFWQQANVITPQGTISQTASNSIMVQPQPPESISTPPALASQQQPAAAKLPDHKITLSGGEIAAIMQDSQDIRDLFKVAETIIGTLKNNQMNSIIWMYDHLGLKKEVIIILLTYCASIEKTNTAYIEKIASAWAENDINTMEAAQDEIQKRNAAKDYILSIMKKFEMNRRPTAKQAEFIEQWKNAGFQLELVHYAYEKTIEQINKLSFDYINKILLSWRDSGFMTVQDVKNAENDFKKNKKGNSSKKDIKDADMEGYESIINQFLY